MQPSQQPPIVLVNNPSSSINRSRVHRHDRSPSPVVIHHDRPRVPQPPVIIQPYGGTRSYEPQRSRSPPAIPYTGPRFHEPQYPIVPPPGLVQQPYVGSRARESRPSRSPRRPIVIQQAHRDSSRSRVHERYHSSSPPPVVVQQSYTGSRLYDNQSSTASNVAQPHFFPGPRPSYDRRGSRTGSRTPPIIIQQPIGQGHRSRSPSPVHLRTSTHDGSRRSHHRPPVIIVQRTPSPASTFGHYDRHAPVIVQLPPSSASGTHYGYRHGEVYDQGQDSQDQSAFTAVDPFRPSVASSINFAPHAQSYLHYASEPLYPSSGGHPVYKVTRRAAWKTLILDGLILIWTFLFNTLPRQIYLYFLLRLPAFYFSRVARIFEEADMTMAEIKGMAYETLGPIATPGSRLPDWDRTIPALDSRLKATWESFINSLIMEWKTQNIVSVLLLSAILTILQIQGAADDPITRHGALLSLVCAMMSLLFGCMYIIRFGSMRKAYKAAEWAAEAQKTKTLIWWNVWVLLAMPAIWLAWSIVLFLGCITAFVWRSGTSDSSPSLLSQHDELGPRIAISAVLGLGVLYFLLVLNTFRRYGDAMDKAWSARVARWARERFSHEKRMQELQYEIDRPWRSPPSTFHSPKGSVYDNEHDYYTHSQVPTRPSSVQNLTLQNFPPWHGQHMPPMHNTQGYAPTQPMQPSYAGSSYSTRIVLPSQRDSSPSIVDPVISMQRAPSVVMSRYSSRSRSRSVSRAREDSRERPTVVQIQRPSSAMSWSYPDPDIPPPTTVVISNTPAEFKFEFDPIKVMDLRFLSGGGNPMPDVLANRRGVEFKDWMRFISEASCAWTGQVPLHLWGSHPSGEIMRPQDAVAEVVERWNTEFFTPRVTRAFLCYEHPPAQGFAIYLVDWTSPGSRNISLEERFKPVLESLQRIDIFDPPVYQSSNRLSFFSKQHRLRGRAHIGTILTRYQTPDPPSRAFSRLTTITERSERSRSPSRPRVEIPLFARTHPEERAPASSRSLRSRSRSRSSSPPSERKSRWSRSPSHIERPVLDGGGASDVHPTDPTCSSPPVRTRSPVIPRSPVRPRSAPMSSIDTPSLKQSPDADIRRWSQGVQSQAMYATNVSSAVQPPAIRISSEKDSRSGDHHHSSNDRESRRKDIDRLQRYKEEEPVIYVRTDPQSSRNDPSSSRHGSTHRSSRHSYLHHSVPVGHIIQLPSDSNHRRLGSGASMASDAHRSHRSKTLTPSSLPHTESLSLGDHVYPAQNGLRNPSPGSGLPQLTNDNSSADRDGIRRPQVTFPPLPLLSPLPIRPISIDFDQPFIQNDGDANEQHMPEVEPPIPQSSTENRPELASTIEGPWKRDIDSLQSILGVSKT